MKRFIWIVLDSVGVGELPDAAKYGDVGSNTLGNTAKAVHGLHLPTLYSLGLGNIIPIEGVPENPKALGAYGKMAAQSEGKDTTTGHWELAGIHLEEPFPTYPEGFPLEIVGEFEGLIGRSVIGNEVASGTEIIERLGATHVATGCPILYTSADSVFQLATHEEVVPIETLYEWCRIARELLEVGRVIARPFLGPVGGFVRTSRRKDFSLKPPSDTLLDGLIKKGIPVYGVGKIADIFAGQGISENRKSKNNDETLDKTLEFLREKREDCLIFANLVDFDMLWGHRNDYASYAQGLEAFDARLPELLSALEEEDILCIVADHGCDPTTVSTDHSREYVPLLVAGKKIHPQSLGVRSTFSDCAMTIAEFFGLEAVYKGTSFLATCLTPSLGKEVQDASL